MALTFYAGNYITGLTADTKPMNIPDGARFQELDGAERYFVKIDGTWEDKTQGSGVGGGIDAITTETTGSNTTVTTSNAAMHVLTMTGNLTATISDFNEAAKTHRFILKVVQDGTGGRTLTIAGNVLFPAGIQPANSESAGAFDLYEFVWDGTNWLLDNKTSAYA